MKEKRKLFGLRKSRSVETSSTGQRIGAIGVQTIPPAVAVDNLPESLQSSTSTIDAPPLKKSGSGSKLFDKFRRNSGRSVVLGSESGSNRGSTEKISSSGFSSVPRGKLDSSWIKKGKGTSRATSEENVPGKVSSTAARYSSFNRLSTSYNNVRATVITSSRRW